MGWVSASDFLRASDREADELEAARYHGRLAAVDRRVEHANPRLFRSRSRQHETEVYHAPSTDRRVSGHLWHATCTCGWHSRRGFRLRTAAEVSARGHAREVAA